MREWYWLLGCGTLPLWWEKERELVREVKRNQLDVVGLNWMNSLGSGTNLLERGWTLFSCGVTQGEKWWTGVGLLIAPQLEACMLGFFPVGERVMVSLFAPLCQRMDSDCLTKSGSGEESSASPTLCVVGMRCCWPQLKSWSGSGRTTLRIFSIPPTHL